MVVTAPPSGVFVGSAGPVLRSQEGSGEVGAFALCARDWGDRLQCLLRTDPAPPGVFGWAPRDRSCARRKARGRWEFSRFARGIGVIAFNACFGPIPLRLAYLGGLRGTGPVLALDRSRYSWGWVFGERDRSGAQSSGRSPLGAIFTRRGMNSARTSTRSVCAAMTWWMSL